MKARTRALSTMLVLVAAAAAAILVAWLGVARRDQAKEARTAAEGKLFSFRAADVTAVTVTAKGDVTRVVREDGGWRIEAPVHAEADRAAVDSLVDRLAGLRRTALVAQAPSDLARYGLAQPRASVTVTRKDGGTDALSLGDENAFDGALFVATGSGTVALVAGDLRWAVERSTLELRDRTVLRFDRDAVDAIRFRRSGTDFEVRRGTAPSRASSFLWILSSLKAKAFVDETGRRAAELGLDRPSFLVILLGKGGQELARLAASPHGGATYAQASTAPAIVELEPSALESLPKTPKDAEEPAPPPPAPTASAPVSPSPPAATAK